MSNYTTTPVPDTNMAVTFDPDSYAGGIVYLHRADAGWHTGTAIGTLGAIVRHGRYGVVGPVTSGAMPHVAREDVLESFTQHTSSEDAAIRMARTWMASAPMAAASANHPTVDLPAMFEGPRLPTTYRPAGV